LAEAVDLDCLELVRKTLQAFEAAARRANELHAVVRGANDGFGIALDLLLGA
jgi:hypothetical protein